MRNTITQITLLTALLVVNAVVFFLSLPNRANGQVNSNINQRTNVNALLLPTRKQFTCDTPSQKAIWLNLLNKLKLYSDLVLNEDIGKFSYERYTCEENLTTKEIDLDGDGKAEVIASIKTIEKCSALGNCPIAIYKRYQNRIPNIERIFFTEAMMNWEVVKHKTNGYLDLIFRFNGSAYPNYLELYKFDGKRYRRTKCFDEEKGPYKFLPTDCWKD